jgi:hypothetical protein
MYIYILHVLGRGFLFLDGHQELEIEFHSNRTYVLQEECQYSIGIAAWWFSRLMRIFSLTETRFNGCH